MIYIFNSYNFSKQNDVINSLDSLVNWLSSEFPHGISAFIGLIVGAAITYLVQKGLKNFEMKITSLNASRYISLILLQERASLKGIEDFIEERNKKNPYQKIFIYPLILKIEQGSVEKILIFKKFYKYNYAVAVQCLIAAEQSYRKCVELIAQYNQAVQKLLEIRASPQRSSMSLLGNGYKSEISSCVENIKNNYEEATKLNKNAKIKFDELCNKTFGKKYKPHITAGIVKATEL